MRLSFARAACATLSLLVASLACTSELGAYPIPALSPPVTSGMVYHVDANDLDGDGIAEGAFEGGVAGGKVNTWVDKASGYVVGDVNQDATQGTGTQQPNFITGGLNSRPVVRFDGVDDFLKSPAFAAPLAQPNQVFLVWKADSAGGSSSTAFDGLTSTNRNAVVYENVGTLSIGVFSGNGVVANYFTTAFSSPVVMSALFNDLNNGAGGADSSFRINGVTVNSTAPSGNQPLDGVTLGSRFAPQAGDLFSLDGYLAEVLIYDTPLSNADRDSVEQYLNFKWFDAASLAPIPEPSTLSLLALGAVGLALKTRRRRAGKN